MILNNLTKILSKMLFNLDRLTGLLLSIYILVITLFMIYISFRMRIRKRTMEGLYNQIIDRMVIDENFERQDLLICYNGFIRRTGLQWSFVRFLEEMCFYLTTQQTKCENIINTNEGNSYSISISNRIKKIYEEEQRVEPFDELDKNTKYLMSDISKGMEIKDKEYVENRLSALSLIIGENERKYHRDKSVNRWSLAIAISGLVISLIMGYITMTKKSISDKDMVKITEVIKTTLIDNSFTIEDDEGKSL